MYITIDPETRAVLERLSKATGLSMAGYVRQMLRHSVPLLERLADAAEIAAKQPAESLAAMEEVLGDAAVNTAQLQIDLGKKKNRPALRKTPKKKKK